MRDTSNFIATISLVRNLETIFNGKQVSVLALYKEQAKLYREYLAKAGLYYVYVSAVDAMQGSENGATILDLTVCQDRKGGLGFVTDRQRLVVGMSRSVDFLAVVGDMDTLDDDASTHGRYDKLYDEEREI